MQIKERIRRPDPHVPARVNHHAWRGRACGIKAKRSGGRNGRRKQSADDGRRSVDERGAVDAEGCARGGCGNAEGRETTENGGGGEDAARYRKSIRHREPSL